MSTYDMPTRDATSTRWRPAWRRRGILSLVGAAFRHVYGLLRLYYDERALVLSQRWWNARAARTARRLGQPLVHVVGDSHVLAFLGQPSFAVHHVGPATAYNLGNSTSTTRASKKMWKVLGTISPPDVVLFSFGEIDCRIHIYYQFKKRGGQVSISDLIAATVAQYRRTLTQVAERKLPLCVYSVPPAGRQDNHYGYPVYADPDTRARIHRGFNRSLQAMCKEYGLAFIDVYPLVTDEHGFIAPDFAADDIHLKAKVADLVRNRIRQELHVAI